MAGRCWQMHASRIRSLQNATACCCQPCHPAPRHSCVPRQGLKPAHGLWPSRLSQEPPFCPQTCSWRYVAACANPCHFAGTRAVHAWVWRSSRPIWRSRTRVPPHRSARQAGKDRGTCLGACRARGAGSGWPGYPPAVACTHYTPKRWS